jgi:hypothetical protein
MKKLATFVFALLLGASLSFAQAGTGGTSTDKSAGSQKTTPETKKKGGKKKGGKKGKKSPTTTSPGTTPK